MSSNDWDWHVAGDKVEFYAEHRIVAARASLGRPTTITHSLSELLGFMGNGSKKPVVGLDNISDALKFAANGDGAHHVANAASALDPKVVKAAKNNLGL